MNKYSIWLKEVKEPWRVLANYYVIDGQWVTFKKIVTTDYPKPKPGEGGVLSSTDHQPVFSAPADSILVINRYDEKEPRNG